MITQLLRPSYYYGRRHDYVYYPESWTDSASGTHYEKGYYDENGKYYDSVAFQKNGRYENVVCHCPYCDTDSILTLDNNVGAAQNLQCPNCGAPMEIRSELDEIMGQGAENTHSYDSEESLRNAFGQPKKKRRTGLVLLLVLFAFMIVSSAVKSAFRAFQREEYQSAPYQQIDITEDNGFELTETVYLEKQADGSYRVVSDAVRADRILSFDSREDSYYDKASDCWLWYNTDVDPAVWQYWYEGISSDFGDCGWMEHDEDGWWIEASRGNWVPLPDRYNTDALWYIAD